MSSGLFHSDWYIYPPWDKVSLTWLINYVRHIRSNPVLTRALEAERGDFEMVPIPKEVINHIASSRLVSTATGAANVGDVEQVATIVRKFGEALEAGRIDEISKMLSPRYNDVSGRDAAGLAESLKTVHSVAAGLRVVPFSSDNLLRIGDHLVARVHAAWEATIDRTKRSESADVELVLEKQGRGWAISSIRVL